MNYRQKIGKLGENVAVRYLGKRGYKILGRNIHFRCGEIDIIAEKDKTLYFVEVKTRTNNKFGYIEDSISDNKIEKIQECVFLYQELNNAYNPYFIVVLCIYLDIKNNTSHVSYFEL